MRITAPAVPEGHLASSWRRTVTAARSETTGTDALPGHWLRPGDEVALPTGTLLLAADKTASGTAVNSRTRRRYTTEDARLTVQLLGPDGTLTVLWDRHYPRASSALGRQAVTKVAALLAVHPAPGGEPVVLAVAQRPNHRTAPCRHECGTDIASADGHMTGSGPAAEFEHWPDCSAPAEPPVPLPRRRLTCDNCERPGRGYAAVDSSGIQGHVCARCSTEPSYQLSFA